MSLALARSSVGPGRRAAVERAGALLKGMRETAGLTAQEVGQAINLRDPNLLEEAERGRIVLPFEIILRLAAVIGRRDPVAFVMKLTRSYNPELWKALENLGVGRLVAHAGREREFVNIYRARDEARRLSDAEFARVLAFVTAAFELALTFVRQERRK
jgi:transcriptional regulator with XRE-family HTH domain